MSESQSEVFTGTTHIAVVLDKSGSMGSVRKETIDGFNVWLKTIQGGPGETLFSLTLFDTRISTPIRSVPVGKVNPLDESRYLPDGSTALLDAIGTTVRETEGAGDPLKDRYLICIMTDGQENASREHSKASIAALIQEKEATGRWTFTYLSAHPDAFADASKIGVQLTNAQAYTGDAEGTEAAFLSNAVGTRTYAASADLKSTDFYGGARHAGSAPSLPRRPVEPAKPGRIVVPPLGHPGFSGGGDAVPATTSTVPTSTSWTQ
jgi:hypothetical protein